MSNSTQTFRLYEVLKSGQPVTVQKIAEELDIKVPSVPVYIHGLKKFKADIQANREGRKVVSYQLNNANDVKILEFRKNASDGKVSPRTSLSVPADQETAANTVTYSEKEIRDIGLSIGVETQERVD